MMTKLYEFVDTGEEGVGYQEILSEEHMQYVIDNNITIHRQSASTNWKITILDLGRKEAIARWRLGETIVPALLPYK